MRSEVGRMGLRVSYWSFTLRQGGERVWQANFGGARLAGIGRGNGVVTAFAYKPEGLPGQVLTGLGEGSGCGWPGSSGKGQGYRCVGPWLGMGAGGW